jgi:hypothetical protein
MGTTKDRRNHHAVCGLAATLHWISGVWQYALVTRARSGTFRMGR